MSDLRISTGIELKKLEINEYGDFISVATGKANQAQFDKFVSMCKKVVESANKCSEEESLINSKYEGKEDSILDRITELSNLERSFTKEANEQIDSVFGEDTMRKYLRKFYEAIPDFAPSMSCFIDFIDQITPVMEQLFDQKALFDKAKMRKYQPQDHKRKSK